jgi:hypothetical protein
VVERLFSSEEDVGDGLAFRIERDGPAGVDAASAVAELIHLDRELAVGLEDRAEIVLDRPLVGRVGPVPSSDLPPGASQRPQQQPRQHPTMNPSPRLVPAHVCPILLEDSIATLGPA